MSKDREEIVPSASQGAPGRQEWRRPEWRTLDANEAETTLSGSNNDTVFS